MNAGTNTNTAAKANAGIGADAPGAKASYAGILQRLQSLKTLQTQPAVIARITQMLQNPATNAEELGRAIKTDQVLASTVLKLVNSAFYGLPGRIGSISHAIVLLGFSTVRNIVLTASVMDMFRMNISGKVSAQDVWKHSLACAAAAQSIARTVGHSAKEECFIAGLLHDIGKAVMFQLIPDNFVRVVEFAEKAKITFYEAESKILGVNHQEVGGMLIEQWRLPGDIRHAVSCHHSPPPIKKDEYRITAIVHCADIMARALGCGSGGDQKIPVVNDAAWDGLGLDKADLARLFDNMETELDRVSMVFQVT